MRQRPAGATSTGDGEPLHGAVKIEATTRQRPVGATSTGDGEPLPGPKTTGRAGATSQEVENASNSELTIYPDLESLSVPKTSISKVKTRETERR